MPRARGEAMIHDCNELPYITSRYTFIPSKACVQNCVSARFLPLINPLSAVNAPS